MATTTTKIMSNRRVPFCPSASEITHDLGPLWSCSELKAAFAPQARTWKKPQCSKCRVSAPRVMNVHAKITLISITQLRDVKRVRHQNEAAPMAEKPACQSKPNKPRLAIENRKCFTPRGAAVGRVNFLPVNFKRPAAWNIDICGLLDIHNLRGS